MDHQNNASKIKWQYQNKSRSGINKYENCRIRETIKPEYAVKEIVVQ